MNLKLQIYSPVLMGLLVALATVPALGQAAQTSATDGGSIDEGMTLHAVRLERPLVLDGALDEDFYEEFPSVSGFVQQFPRGGEPATEDTEVWIFFDDTNIYVSMLCWDSNPDEMVADEMRRDNRNIWLNDNVMVVIDTFLDRRSGFFFQTNPLGGVREALIINETTTNYDWNTVWDLKTRRLDEGWSVEMAIPFKSLRYSPVEPQKWGFNIMRVVRSKNEQTLLSPVPLTYGGQGIFRLASAADLVGIDPPESSRNLEVKPYAISNLTTNRPAGISNDLDGDFGVDARYGLTSSMTFDLTYNTDFAQVEIDEQQVNLTRFSLFFPEKRDFFLEGQGVFDFAGSGAGGGIAGAPDDTPLLFFSRRIGLDQAIQAGGRLMGRAGRFTVGALNIQTDDSAESGALATNFSVMRVKRDILGRSNVGLIMTNRSPSSPGGGSNQVYGFDANMGFYENIRVTGFYARSATSGITGDTESYRGQFQYAADRYGFELSSLKVGDAFNPEVGFLRREDFQRSFALGRFSPRPTSIDSIRKLTWEASLARYVNGAGLLETEERKGGFAIEFENSDLFRLDYLRTFEEISEPFEVASDVSVPAGEYRFQKIEARYDLGPQRWVSGALNFSRGGFYTGHRTEIGFSGRVKLSPQFAIEPRTSLYWVNLPEGVFRVTLAGARPTFTITPRMFVSALVQYNSSFDTMETNVRWRWEYQPGSDLFVVYTDGRDTSRPGYPELINRGLAVKFTRFLRF